MKLWQGRFTKELDANVHAFNASIGFDQRLVAQDIRGSMAHASMLAKQGIISAEDAEAIAGGLQSILDDLQSGALAIDQGAEDIHSFVEAELTARVGDAGKRLHTARSRNDQVALDTKLYTKEQIVQIGTRLKALIEVLLDKALAYADAVMPGYTHLQRAQPISFGHHLAAYAAMFLRDLRRLGDCLAGMGECPLGSAALAGTTHPIDRFDTARALGFDAPCTNSLDGVSDRDYALELLADIAILMTHLSRFGEEVVLWCSWEFRFLELDDAYATGSSIMPQKKNPDIAELVRGKAGRTYGNLMALLTTLKGLPLAYNKDMQEDKEALFDSIDTARVCLEVFADMVATATVLTENMKNAARRGYINATDCADYLVRKGMPFRTAYAITGQMVHACIERSIGLDEMPLAQMQTYSPLFEADVYQALDLNTCMQKRASYGGPARPALESSLRQMRAQLGQFFAKLAAGN